MWNHQGVIMWICRTGQKPEPEPGMFKLNHGVMSCFPQVSDVVNFTKYCVCVYWGGGGGDIGAGIGGGKKVECYFSSCNLTGLQVI